MWLSRCARYNGIIYNTVRFATYSQQNRHHSTVPVTVLSGFLGAGKTTLLNNILKSDNHEKKLAVIVNDMSEINIDADLVVGNTFGGNNDQPMVQLENGCICCTLRDDLVAEIATLVKRGDIDHIVVESTGVSEPLPVAQTFSAPIIKQDEEHKTDDSHNAIKLTEATAGLNSLQDVAHLHNLVTVVDCSTLLDHLKSVESLKTLQMEASEEDNRSLGHLLVDQIQFANTILMNKQDSVSDEESKLVKQLIDQLNPTATLHTTTNAQINVLDLLQKQLYNEDEYLKLAEWEKELVKKPQSELEEYGIQHFSIQILGRPFHPSRWHHIMTNLSTFKGVLRSKGYFWTAAEYDTRFDLSLVGRFMKVAVSSFWVDVGGRLLSDPNFKIDVGDNNPAIRRSLLDGYYKRSVKLEEKGLWHPRTQDRRIELVFIGDSSINQEKIENAIEKALVTDKEFDTFLKSGAFPDNPLAQVPRCVVMGS